MAVRDPQARRRPLHYRVAAGRAFRDLVSNGLTPAEAAEEIGEPVGSLYAWTRLTDAPDAGTCTECGRSFRRATRGRPRTTCSAACRVAAHRRGGHANEPWRTPRGGMIERRGEALLEDPRVVQHEGSDYHRELAETLSRRNNELYHWYYVGLAGGAIEIKDDNGNPITFDDIRTALLVHLAALACDPYEVQPMVIRRELIAVQKGLPEGRWWDEPDLLFDARAEAAP